MRRFPAHFSVLALAALALAAFAPSARADAPSRLALEGAPAAVTPPAGEWLTSTTTPAAGQWVAGFRAKDGLASLEARVFPVKDLREPRRVLLQAIDLAARSAVAEGFGLGGVTTTTLEGRPVADGSFTAVVGGVLWVGHARLLLVTEHAWAFAWGMAAEDAPAARHEAVKAFALSLMPTGPRFYEPAFRATDLDVAVVEVSGEAPITNAHLHAAVGLLEIGLRTRFSMAGARSVRGVLLEAARGKPTSAEARTRLREALVSVRDADALSGSMRRTALALAGPPFLGVARRRDLALGEKLPDPVQDAASAHREWAAFLASLALDVPLVASDVPADLLPSPETLDDWEAGARETWLVWGTAWAAARRAWDLADGGRRFRFRREVLLLLAPAEDRSRVEALSDPTALRAYFDERKGPDLERTLKAALDLDEAARRRLLEVLETRDEGYVLGW